MKIFKIIWAGLVAAWKWADGKKRTIALIYWSLAMPAIAIIWPDHAPPLMTKIVELIGLLFSFLGLGHAVVKQVRGSGQDTAVPVNPNSMDNG